MAEGERVNVVGPSGGLENVAAENLEALLSDPQTNYRLATPQEVSEETQREKFGGLEHKLRAFKQASDAGFTFDLSDVAAAKGAEALGGPEALKRMQEQQAAYKELHGGTQLVGRLGGAVGGALAAAPLRPVQALGRAYRGAGALGKIGMGAGVGAAEGAAASAGQAWAESSLGGQELSGEKLATAVGSGAMLGAAVGGAFGGGAAGLGRLRSSSLRRAAHKGELESAKALTKTDTPEEFASIMDQVYGYRPAGAEQKVSRFLSKQMARVGGLTEHERKLMSYGMEGGARGERVRRAMLDPASVQDDYVEKLYAELSPLYRHSQKVLAQGRGGLKERQIARALRASDAADPSRAVRSHQAARVHVAELRETIDRIVSDKGVDFIPVNYGPGKKAFERIGAELDGIEGLLGAGRRIEKDYGARTFARLDDLKRSIAGEKERLTRLSNPTRAQLRTGQELESAYKNTQRLLEDEGLWGEAARIQKNINPFWSEWVPAHGKKKKHNNLLRLFLGAEEGKWGKDVLGIDKKKIGAYYRSLKNPDVNPHHEALRRYLQANQDMVEATSRWYNLSAADQKLVKELGERTKRVLKIMDGATDDVAIANMTSDILRRRGGPGFGGSALVGAVSFGAPGAAIGGLMNLANNPVRTVRQVGAIRKLIGSVDKRIARSAGALGRGGTVSALPSLRGAVTKTSATYEKRAQTARLASSTPQATRATLNQALAPLSPAAPGIAAVAVNRAIAAQEYLNTQLPKVTADELLYGTQPYTSTVERSRFERVYEALEDPPVLLERLQKGTISRDQVDAVRAVFPEMFAEMQTAVSGELTRLASKGKRLPYSERIAIGVMFDMPTDPSLANMGQIQKFYAPDQGKPAGSGSAGSRPGKAPNLAAAFNYETGAEEIEFNKG